MKNFSKRTQILLVVFIVVAAFGLLILKDYNKQVSEVTDNVSPTPSVQPVVSKKPATGTVSQSQTYTALVKEYEGRRIQFDINCQAIPSSVTYKNGTKVMFDNRSGDARIITVGGVQYNVAGYGYKILTLSSPTLPKNLLLSCGAAVNVGQILLQN